SASTPRDTAHSRSIRSATPSESTSTPSRSNRTASHRISTATPHGSGSHRYPTVYSPVRCGPPTASLGTPGSMSVVGVVVKLSIVVPVYGEPPGLADTVKHALAVEYGCAVEI